MQFCRACVWSVTCTAIARAAKRHDQLQVELLCNMVVSEENYDRVDKVSAHFFVLTCLRSGVRLDLKPQKTTTGLVAHVRRV